MNGKLFNIEQFREVLKTRGFGSHAILRFSVIDRMSKLVQAVWGWNNTVARFAAGFYIIHQSQRFADQFSCQQN